MSPAAEQVYRSALALPEDDRNAVLNALNEAAHADPFPFDESLREMIAERSAQPETDDIPWEVVREEGRRRLNANG